MNNFKKNKGENGLGGHIAISVRERNVIFLPGAYFFVKFIKSFLILRVRFSLILP